MTREKGVSWYSFLLKCFSQYARIFECFPLDLSCFGSIITTNDRKIKIYIGTAEASRRSRGEKLFRKRPPLTHAIFFKQVRFRIVLAKSNNTN